MPTIQKNELKKRVKANGIQHSEKWILEAMESQDGNAPELKPSDFSLRDVFEAFVVNRDGEQVGKDVLEELFNPNRPHSHKTFTAMEAAGAVSSDAFSNIAGQILYNAYLEGYQAEAFVFTQLIPTINTMFEHERIAGISDIGDKALIVAETESYPLAGVNEDYIDTPQTIKRGIIVPVTKEAVFFDRTGQMLERCRKVGEVVGINKEKRAIDCMIDENTTAHRYKWRGSIYATYQTAAPWINDKTSNGLVDWTNVDAAEQMLAGITDPNTGEPVMVMADTIMVNPQLEKAALRILNSTGTVVHTGGYPVTGNVNASASPNPLLTSMYTNGRYRLVSSRLMPTRTGTDTDWYLGSPAKALAYMQNWPITLSQAPPNSEEEFQRDIVYRFKASERGAYVVRDPRFLQRNAQ